MMLPPYKCRSFFSRTQTNTPIPTGAKALGCSVVNPFDTQCTYAAASCTVPGAAPLAVWEPRVRSAEPRSGGGTAHAVIFGEDGSLPCGRYDALN